MVNRTLCLVCHRELNNQRSIKRKTGIRCYRRCKKGYAGIQANFVEGPMILSSFRQHTPIEEYEVAGRTIYVKREDLFGVQPEMPPLAKLRGMRVVLSQLHKKGVTLVGNQDTAVSKSGWGVAAICRELGMSCVLGYPQSKDGLPEQIRIAQELGAELYPLKPNYIRILYSQTKSYVENRRGVMLPFGISCPESAKAVAKEAATVPSEFLTGTLFICVGSGTTLAGIIVGLKRLPKIIGVSSGMSLKNQEKNLNQLLTEVNVSPPRRVEMSEKLTIIPPIMPYSERCHINAPFPMHPNYDAKAWLFMKEHIHEWEEPILFWNIGS